MIQIVFMYCRCGFRWWVGSRPDAEEWFRGCPRCGSDATTKQGAAT